MSLAPKGADYARDYIGQLEAGNPNKNARKRMAEINVNGVGGYVSNYTDEGRAVWAEYLATFK